MKPIPIEDLARALDARLCWPTGTHREGAGESLSVGPGVVVDSRRVSAGALFVALPGGRMDGYGFAASAAAAGAGAMLAKQPSDDLPTLVVEDPQLALGRLARFVVDAAESLAVIGVTGSSGKTSTKDLLAQILETFGPTVAPVGSFNNEIGLPLTACQVGGDTGFLISEMGARGIGHIAYLCELTPPSIGIELNVGRAHLGEFGGQETIALAKSELVAALPTSGVAVLNADDPRVAVMAAKTEAELAWFSAAAEPTQRGRFLVWATDVLGDDHGRHTFILHVRDGHVDQPGHQQSFPVRLQTSGGHQVSNALAAAAAAVALGLPPDRIAEALTAAEPRSAWRMEITERSDGVTIINDAYNANPESMRAALTTTANMMRSGGGAAGTLPGEENRPKRGIAVLGDMLELGDSAEQAHEELGALVAELNFDRLIAIGEFGPAVCRGAAGILRGGGGAAGVREGVAASLASTKGEILSLLQRDLRAGDIVVVKASRGLGLETVAQTLARPEFSAPAGIRGFEGAAEAAAADTQTRNEDGK